MFFHHLHKKIFSLLLILSLTIPANAAVSVSDGSAFVSKAEFSTDITNLSNRMAQLENSLDAKIDSLVSSYLSRNGIWNGEAQEISSEGLKGIDWKIYTDVSASGKIGGFFSYAATGSMGSAVITNIPINTVYVPLVSFLGEYQSTLFTSTKSGLCSMVIQYYIYPCSLGISSWVPAIAVTSTSGLSYAVFSYCAYIINTNKDVKASLYNLKTTYTFATPYPGHEAFTYLSTFNFFISKGERLLLFANSDLNVKDFYLGNRYDNVEGCKVTPISAYVY